MLVMITVVCKINVNSCRNYIGLFQVFSVNSASEDKHTESLLTMCRICLASQCIVWMFVDDV